MRRASVISGIMMRAAQRNLSQAVRLLQLDLGIGDKLDGIREEDIDELAAYADKEGNPLYPVPKLMDKTELAQFYRDVMK
jgi:alcohol dehydrogenase class IV